MRVLAAALLLLALPLNAAEGWSLRGEWRQGNLLAGKAPPATQVWFNERKLRLSAQGDFIFGLDRDEAPEATLKVQIPGAPLAETFRYTVEKRDYEIQRIDGLPAGQVNPPKSALARIKREQQQMRAARERDSARTDFTSAMQWPVQGRISGVFGSQRILNGEAKNAHAGVDVAVPTGTRIVAPLSGVVSLAQRDFYYTGGTLLIDHGHGLTSLMVHLSKLLIGEGEVVQQGQPVAEAGMTGRATGPHLHWGVFWFGARVDAQSLVPPMQVNSAKKPSPAP